MSSIKRTILFSVDMIVLVCVVTFVQGNFITYVRPEAITESGYRETIKCCFGEFVSTVFTT